MIHKFSMDDIFAVLDTVSGSVHAVDKLVYIMLDSYEIKSVEEIISDLNHEYEETEIISAYNEITELKDAGLLFADDEYEMALNRANMRQPVVKALCLHVAHDCNLKCRYCFACEGEYNGKRSLMSAQIGKQAIDFIIKNSGQRRNLEVDFFGGEPLMNFEVVKETVEYARGQEGVHNKNFRFTITTNGVLLDEEKQEYINQHMSNVVLSIDGRKNVNDNMRERAGGQGSYDLIVPKFLEMAKKRGHNNYYVRGTYTSHNLDFSEDVLHLAELGFKQISVEPVVAPPNRDYAITDKHIPKLSAEYEKLAEELHKRRGSEQEFNFFHFNIDLTGGPCAIKRLVGCGAGTEYLAVTPEGELYPCHQFVGIDEFKMGNVWEGVLNTEKREKFAACNVYSKPECAKCWAKMYCSGGCGANAYFYGGDILSIYEIGCELQRKRIECAIVLKIKEGIASLGEESTINEA